jgi:4-hydroxy-tetrahydrodipicolinate reductase
MKIRVVIVGALGKMGRETARAVDQDEELELVGLVELRDETVMKSELTGNAAGDFRVESDLAAVLETAKPDIVVDFTNPHAVCQNARTALARKVGCVIGTTGLLELEMEELKRLAAENGVPLAIIPNFAVGAVLMMQMAAEAAKYLPDVEIIELHHNQKVDAPSGTAIKTAEMILARQQGMPSPPQRQEYEKLSGARGGNLNGIRIHSVRLNGLVAHQEVILGGPGQTLTIRHDSYDRRSFMPGVLLAIKKLSGSRQFIYGLENLL